MPLHDHLPRGRDNAVTLSELAERMNVSRREVEAMVQDARLAGEPIVSGSEGIWLGTDGEALEWVARQRSRAIRLMESAQGVQRGVEARRAIGDQVTLWAA